MSVDKNTKPIMYDYDGALFDEFIKSKAFEKYNIEKF